MKEQLILSSAQSALAAAIIGQHVTNLADAKFLVPLAFDVADEFAAEADRRGLLTDREKEIADAMGLFTKNISAYFDGVNDANAEDLANAEELADLNAAFKAMRDGNDTEHPAKKPSPKKKPAPAKK